MDALEQAESIASETAVPSPEFNAVMPCKILGRDHGKPCLRKSFMDTLKHDQQADATEFSALLLDWLQRELADGGSTRMDVSTLSE